MSTFHFYSPKCKIISFPVTVIHCLRHSVHISHQFEFFSEGNRHIFSSMKINKQSNGGNTLVFSRPFIFTHWYASSSCQRPISRQWRTMKAPHTSKLTKRASKIATKYPSNIWTDDIIIYYWKCLSITHFLVCMCVLFCYKVVPSASFRLCIRWKWGGKLLKLLTNKRTK